MIVLSGMIGQVGPRLVDATCMPIYGSRQSHQTAQMHLAGPRHNKYAAAENGYHCSCAIGCTRVHAAAHAVLCNSRYGSPRPLSVRGCMNIYCTVIISEASNRGRQRL